MTSHIISVDRFLVRAALKPITVKKGDTLQVELVESASTGYVWSAKADHIDHIKDVVETFVPSEDDVVGSPTPRTMVFVANKTDELILEYRRPWETGRANKLLTMKVVVE
jgi:predicted secreted protein